MALSKERQRFLLNRNSCEELQYSLLPAVGNDIFKKVADPWIELYKESIDSIQPVIDKGWQLYKTSCPLKGLEKLVEPWIELYDDGLENIQIIAESGKCFYNTYIWGTPASLKLLAHVTSLTICDHPLTRSLRELIEDGGRLWVPLLCLAFCGPSGGASLVLAKTALANKAVFFVAGGIMFIGAQIHQQKIGAAPTLVRPVHQRVVCGLVLTGSIYFGLGFGGLEQVAHFGGFSDVVAAYIAHPMLFAYFCKDIVVYPLMLINIQFISGVPVTSVIPAIILNCVGSGFAAATFTTVLPAGYHMYFNVAALSSMILSTLVMVPFEHRAAQKIGMQNKLRVQNAVYSTLVWWMPQFVILVARAGLADIDNIETVLAMLDILAKVGVCHITLRSRPSLDNAASHFGSLRDEDQRT